MEREGRGNVHFEILNTPLFTFHLQIAVKQSEEKKTNDTRDENLSNINLFKFLLRVS